MKIVKSLGTLMKPVGVWTQSPWLYHRDLLSDVGTLIKGLSDIRPFVTLSSSLKLGHRRTVERGLD